MRACFLGDSGAKRRSIAGYATERQAGIGKKEAAYCIKDISALTIV